MEDIIKIFGGSFIAGIVLTGLIHLWKGHGFGFINIIKNSFGALFIFSASVKAIDPLGTAYKMGEYFESFHTEFMIPLALSFSVIMILLEFLLAIALILGWRKKLTIYALFAMNIFFLILTGYTYLTGHVPNEVGFFDFAQWTEWVKTNMKVTDCGCFGDFIKQTPLEAFIKDWIIIALLILIWLGQSKIKEVFYEKLNLKIIGVLGLIFLWFNFSNFYFNKPLVDFRPYAVGKNINEQRVEVPDQLDYGFLFKNTTSGEEKRVVMGEYSSYSSNPEWEFTGKQDNIVLKEGIEAKINNFGAFDRAGNDQTDDILSYEGYTIWVLSKKIDESHLDAWKNIKALENFAFENNYRIFAFSSSVFKETDVFKKEHQLQLDFYQADDVFIKTILRANPGVVLLKNAEVIAKWHHKHLPSVDELKALIK